MKFYALITFVFLFLFSTSKAISQKKNQEYVYSIKKTSELIAIDGNEDDPAWLTADLATGFSQVLPIDTGKAIVNTEVRMLFDDTHIYLLAVNYKYSDEPLMVESLRRDFSFGKNDNFLIFIDPFEDQTNGFTFGSNAQGAQWDGLLFEGGKADLSWENKWRSKVKVYADRWVLEMAIPFKTLRYKKGIDEWGINFSRLDLQAAEKSAWAPVPRQFPTASLAYTGILKWEELPPEPGANVSVIPYVLGGVSSSTQFGETATPRGGVGIDAKVGLTSSLNLDLTYNPDFSQVEVDVQQTNLDRFELFFPERRQFFLENADIFGNFGYQTLRPFFSRRIGLNAPIRFGARLSGKVNKDWRVGAMNMQTGESNDGVPAQNFSVLSVQRKVFARSNLSAIIVNKQTLNYDQLANPGGTTAYNRNIGLEYNHASSDNKWTGKLLYLNSISPEINSGNNIVGGNLAYTGTSFFTNFQIENVGENFRAETGFVPRVGYTKLENTIGYLFFPKSKRIQSHGPLTFINVFFNNEMRYIESVVPILYRINFLNRSSLMFWAAYDNQELQRPFDPTNFAGEFLEAGTEHTWFSTGGSYTSKPQSLFTYEMNWRYGGYYADGTRLNLGGEFGYRFQPFVAINLSTQFNRIEFGDDYRLPQGLINENYNLWLFGPRVDVTLTNKLFITNFVQFNNQTENVNLNLRLQWRYSPASDLFIVYTSNYGTNISSIRNQAIVAKFNYWWNI